jgi:hypothetical protein
LKTKQQKIFEMKVALTMAFGMGIVCFLVGLLAELHIAFPDVIRNTSPENLLPFGIVLIVVCYLAIRYLEKKAPIADEEMKFLG